MAQARRTRPTFFLSCRSLTSWFSDGTARLVQLTPSDDLIWLHRASMYALYPPSVLYEMVISCGPPASVYSFFACVGLYSQAAPQLSFRAPSICGEIHDVAGSCVPR